MPTINNTALIVTGQLGVVVWTWGGDCVRFPSSFILRTLDSSQLPRLGSPSGGHLNTGDQAVAGGGHIYAIKDRRLSPGTCRHAAADISHCKSLGGGQHLWGITVPWLTADWVMVARARIRFPERLQPPAIWPTVVVVGAVVQTARPASCSCADSAVETVHSSPPPRPAPSSPQSGETNRGDTTAAISWADHCWSPVGSEEREEVPPSQLHWIVMHLSHLMNDMRNTTNEWIPLNQRMFLSFVENEQSS